MSDELQKIAERYEQRKKTVPVGFYSLFHADGIARMQEKQRALLSLLKKNGISDLSATAILEIGCGSGTNLLELLQLGATPELLAANELLPDRIEQARNMLPASVHLHPGNVANLEFKDESFDIVYQSTVFTSILDDTLQQKIAQCMWRWTRKGGGILWYDFTFDNPKNRDVRGVPMKRIRELFPEGLISSKRITLAPPIAWRVARTHPWMYPILNAFPFLRTHLLCFIKKI